MTKSVVKTKTGAAKKAVSVKSKVAGFRDNLPEILSPTVDVIFKILFGDERNKDILADFLSAVFGFEVKADDITLIDPHLQRDRATDKLGILDIKLRLAGGKYVNIEMQVGNLKYIRNRIEYYISNMITRQMEKSDKYQQLLPVVAIIVSKYEMLPETKRFHCEFGTLEKTEHFELHGLRAIHTLELSKLPKNLDGKLGDWLKFINSEKREDYMSVAQRSKPMRRAFKVLEKASADRRTRDEYFYSVLAAADEQARAEYWIDEAREQGAQEGLKQGLQQGLKQGVQQGLKQGVQQGLKQGLQQGEHAKALKIAKAMKASGDSIDHISEVTDLTPDEIRQL